jgi:purine-nucleoside phosphorylase
MAKHLHIMAEEGAIAETVLLPGDPLRAKFIAENYLENAKCYNEDIQEHIKVKEFLYKVQVWDYHLILYMLMS